MGILLAVRYFVIFASFLHGLIHFWNLSKIGFIVNEYFSLYLFKKEINFNLSLFPRINIDMACGGQRLGLHLKRYKPYSWTH